MKIQYEIPESGGVVVDGEVTKPPKRSSPHDRFGTTVIMRPLGNRKGYILVLRATGEIILWARLKGVIASCQKSIETADRSEWTNIIAAAQIENVHTAEDVSE